MRFVQIQVAKIHKIAQMAADFSVKEKKEASAILKNTKSRQKAFLFFCHSKE